MHMYTVKNKLTATYLCVGFEANGKDVCMLKTTEGWLVMAFDKESV